MGTVMSSQGNGKMIGLMEMECIPLIQVPNTQASGKTISKKMLANNNGKMEPHTKDNIKMVKSTEKEYLLG